MSAVKFHSIVLGCILLMVCYTHGLNSKDLPKFSLFSHRSPSRNVGPIEATPNEFPYIADIRIGSHKCSGSIISSEWVLTSALCAEAPRLFYTIIAGDHNITQVEGREQTRNVDRIVTHPGYGFPSLHSNDIALMKVKPPFEFNEFVSATIIPEVNFITSPVATVAGWGAGPVRDAYSSVLLKVDLPQVSAFVCNSSYVGEITDSILCYGDGRQDYCHADSGSPLLCGDERTLCGIGSGKGGCATPGLPGLYTETADYNEWIKTTTTYNPEDAEPVTIVNTCGGPVIGSSASINFSFGNTPPSFGEKCVWIVQGPYEEARFRLTTSSLGRGGYVFVTNYNVFFSSPGVHFKILTLEEDYIISGGVFLVTLVAGEDVSQEFSLEFYSSGFLDLDETLTGSTVLTDTSGSYSYPAEGKYGNGENSVFVLNPSLAGDRVLTFTAVDIPDDRHCFYDRGSISTWYMEPDRHGYSTFGVFCGTTLPAPIDIPRGDAYLINFSSNETITGNGFTFTWELI